MKHADRECNCYSASAWRRAEIRQQELYFHQRRKALSLASFISPSALFHSTALWVSPRSSHFSSTVRWGFQYYSSPFHFTTLFIHRGCFPLFSAIRRGDVIPPNTPPATSYCLMPHRTLVVVLCAAAACKIFIGLPLPNYCFPFLITFGLSPPQLCRWRWGRVV